MPLPDPEYQPIDVNDLIGPVWVCGECGGLAFVREMHSAWHTRLSLQVDEARTALPQVYGSAPTTMHGGLPRW